MRKLSGGRLLSWLFVVTIAWISTSTLYLLAICWPFNTDDAYITLRYAKHFAQGHGIVWNIGDAPLVEGYSNFVFVLIGALAIRLGLDPLFFLKLICCLSLPLTCCMLYKLGRTWLSPMLALLPMLILTSYVGTVWWTVSGLETSFYQMLAVAAVLVFVKGFYADCSDSYRWKFSQRHLFASGLLVLFSALTRPEGPIIGVAFGVTFVLLIVLKRINVGSGMKGGLLMAAAFFIPYAIYLVWKLEHFQRILPNTVYCKANYLGPPAQLLKDFLLLAWPYMLLGLGALRKRFDLRLIPCLIMPILYGAILYQVDPMMGHWNRHFLTAYAMLLIVATVGVHRISIALPIRRSSTVELCVIVTFLATSMLTFPVRMVELSKSTEAYVTRTATREQVADWLKKNLSESDIYVIGDTGLIPYLSRSKVIDAYCINSVEMTSPPISMSSDRFIEAILVQKPSAIIVHSYSGTELRPHRFYDIFSKLVLHSTFQENYLHTATFGASEDNFHYWVYRINE